jgi:hypothetical protein
MYLNSKLVFSCKDYKSEKFLIYPFSLFILICFFVLLIDYIRITAFDDKISGYLKGFVAFLLFSNVFGICFLSWMLFKVFKRKCFRRVVNEWKIFNTEYSHSHYADKSASDLNLKDIKSNRKACSDSVKMENFACDYMMSVNYDHEI